MKKIIIAVLFSSLTVTLSAKFQNSSYPFEVKISGDGQRSIIFIPGFACSGEVWNETKAKFEDEFKCYTLTMAGFAGAKPQLNPTFQNWEDGIVNFIKENKIENPILVGHSMGGGLALAIAADYPSLISRIIVVDALPCLPFLINPSFKSLQTANCSDIVEQLTSMSIDQFYLQQKNSVSRLLADTTKQDLIVDWGTNSDRKTFAEMYCDFSNVDLREKIKSIKCPSLILLEPYFKNITPAIESQYRNMKTANLQYANKGLHFIMFDDKDWYMDQVNNFLTIK